MQTQQSQLTKKTFLHENDVGKGEKKKLLEPVLCCRRSMKTVLLKHE